QAARRADGPAGKGWRKKRKPTCKGLDRGCGVGQHHPTRKGANFQAWSLFTRKLDKPLERESR
ncbi:MAG: hypothetical protein ACFFEK_17790, partial [Candidatus Thorarchaeota archaeon]